MADFEKSIEKVLIAEGGYVNNTNDRGGETKYGISKRAYPDINIGRLTIERAKEIYKRDYWDRLNLDLIVNQSIADEVFDTAVNMGIMRAGRLLQKALNLIDDYGLIEDGMIGEKTIHAVNTCKYQKALLKALNGLQFMAYVDIIERNESQKIFFRGWLKRIHYA